MRAAAREAGRDPDAPEYTRWASIGMARDDVDGFARQGVTRLVIGAGSRDPQEQRDELSEFASRMGLP